MRVFITTLLIGAAVILGACSGSIMPTSPPPSYYQIGYHASPIDKHCDNAIRPIIKIWPFSAESPFGKTNMIVEEPESFKLVASESHQWIAKPGSMIAERIKRDLDRDLCFIALSSSEPTLASDMELSGTIEKWSFGKVNENFFALLEVSVTVWKKKPKPAVLFKKHYAFKGNPAKEPSPELFAKEMSFLVEAFSKSLREDLYQLAISSGDF